MSYQRSPLYLFASLAVVPCWANNFGTNATSHTHFFLWLSLGHLVSTCHAILCSHWLSISVTLFPRGSSLLRWFWWAHKPSNWQIGQQLTYLIANNWLYVVPICMFPTIVVCMMHKTLVRDHTVVAQARPNHEWWISAENYLQLTHKGSGLQNLHPHGYSWMLLLAPWSKQVATHSYTVNKTTIRHILSSSTMKMLQLQWKSSSINIRI